MFVSLYFDIKNFRSANFSRIVITVLVCAMMPIGLHRNNLHITFLPQSTQLGELPLASCHEQSTISEPLYAFFLRMLRFLFL